MEKTIAERTAEKCFVHFKESNFDMNGTPRLGWPSDFDEDLLNSLINAYPLQTIRGLASEMGCDHSTINQHLQSVGNDQKLGVWVPLILTQDDQN
jgi:hypothetical protein